MQQPRCWLVGSHALPERGVALSIRETVVAGELVESGPASGAIDVSGLQAVSMPALAFDALIVICTSVLTGIIYTRLALGQAGDTAVFAGTGGLAALIFCTLMRARGASRPLRVSTASGRARSAITIWIVTFLSLIFVAFALKVSASFSRGAILSFFLAGLPLIVASRIAVPRAVARIGQATAYRGLDAIVLAARGYPGLADFLNEFRLGGCGSTTTIEFDGDVDGEAWTTERCRLIQRTLESARRARAGDIYVVAPGLPHERITSIVSGLRLVPRAVCVVPDEIVAGFLRSTVRSIGPTVAVEVQRAPLSKVQRFGKRTLDIAIASVATLILAPLFLLIAIAIKLDSPGPVFFRQVRNGYRSQPFRIWKFRTMHVLEDGPGIAQASRHDWRVTRVGRFLRHTSLDECPQLFNVLTGEMSLVGPRPHAAAHDELYESLIENYALRQHVKPGITGWAQVNGYRGETPTVDNMYQRIESDLWYAANCSLALDFGILVRTLGVFFGQQNAY